MELANGLVGRKLTVLLTLKRVPCKLWLQRHRTRKQLKALLEDDPERLLRDVGIDLEAARVECCKWFWVG